MAINPDMGDKEQIQPTFEQLSALPLPNFFFNSFANGGSASDMASVLLMGSRPVAMLMMAPVTAKTFATELLKMVSAYEEQTGQIVQTVQEIMARVTKDQA